MYCFGIIITGLRHSTREKHYNKLYACTGNKYTFEKADVFYVEVLKELEELYNKMNIQINQ